MYPDLKGKVALVTGAGRQKGLGEAMARRLAEEGCEVVVSDLGQAQGEQLPGDAIGDETEMAAVVHAIEATGGKAHAIACNMLEEDQVKGLIDETVALAGQIDILVNNAGIGYLMNKLIDLDAADWDTVQGVNLRGVFLATKYAARKMIDQGQGGRIINIASQAAKSAFPYAAAYTSSKHGLIGLSRVTAIELAEHQITCNVICPNHVTTGLGAWQNQFFSQAFGQTEEEYLDAMRTRIPLGRPGLTDDIAKACAFLASDQASYITGEALNVSGGEEYH